MATDANGYKRPGSDPRDKDLTERERKALANENSGSTGRRAAVVAGRGKHVPAGSGKGWGRGGKGI